MAVMNSVLWSAPPNATLVIFPAPAGICSSVEVWPLGLRMTTFVLATYRLPAQSATMPSPFGTWVANGVAAPVLPSGFTTYLYRPDFDARYSDFSSGDNVMPFGCVRFASTTDTACVPG